jgi:hypothetical protein
VETITVSLCMTAEGLFSSNLHLAAFLSENEIRRLLFAPYFKFA